MKYLFIILAMFLLSSCGDGSGSAGNNAGDTSGDSSGDTSGDTSGDNAGDTSGDNAGDSAGGSNNNVQTTATYTITFQASWTSEKFPTNFPGGDHFSGLIGATHNESVVFWQRDSSATAGIESMAEVGSKSLLTAEIETARNAGNAQFTLSGGGLGSGISSTALQFNISQEYSLVTLVSMIAPSPDWFVGVNGVDLFVNGDWVDSMVINLFLYDAGTDGGETFVAANSNTTGETITRLTTDAANTDFNDGIHRTSGDYVGQFTFQKTE